MSCTTTLHSGVLFEPGGLKCSCTSGLETSSLEAAEPHLTFSGGQRIRVRPQFHPHSCTPPPNKCHADVDTQMSCQSSRFEEAGESETGNSLRENTDDTSENECIELLLPKKKVALDTEQKAKMTAKAEVCEKNEQRLELVGSSSATSEAFAGEMDVASLHTWEHDSVNSLL